MGGALHVVAVPIGNLEDITVRARRLLETADRVACEDTRQTGRLIELLGLPKRPLVSLHDHNEADRIPGLLAAIEAGEQVALVSDAGTPTVSDPGFKLVRAVIDAGLTVVPVPGVCAAITALCAAGLPTDRFRFIGFVPAKGAALRTALAEVAGAAETLIFYVSPHGLDRFLAAAAEVFGVDRPAVIARELTKKFEEFRRATLGELVEDPGTVRGELVVLVGGAPAEAAPDASTLEATVALLLREGYSSSKAAREAARRTGGSRDEAYRFAIALREADESDPADE
ncbi:MAG: 16S rRNA (cytidine(1402)-2'-O)-methyltransferase [Myxococcales bacterium]|nr:16S rRNA (cytidine(1402)-2'-O)-methyltransferase [Myxococcales bacterium]